MYKDSVKFVKARDVYILRWRKEVSQNTFQLSSAGAAKSRTALLDLAVAALLGSRRCAGAPTWTHFRTQFCFTVVLTLSKKVCGSDEIPTTKFIKCPLLFFEGMDVSYENSLYITGYL